VGAGRRRRRHSAVARTIVGYNVLSWTESGVAYWAVSDLAPADLATFVKLFRAGIPQG
jgi:hypothetical protein